MSILSSHDENQSLGGLSGGPKTMFLLGLATGIGSISVPALVLLVSLMLKGQTLGALASGGVPNDSAKVAAATTPAPNPSAADANEPTLPVSFVKPVDEKIDHIRGNKNAKVTLIEYSDFECPFCLRHLDTVNQLLNDYKNDVRLVYRHFPLKSLHSEAQKAAEASECAAQQGKFWEMHDKIFEANKAGNMSVQRWKDVARELDLDTNKFNTCLDSGETASRVAQDAQEGGAAGVTGTPGTFVNGKLVAGAVPLATFKQIVEQEGAKN